MTSQNFSPWASDHIRDGHVTQVGQIRLNPWTLAVTIEKEQVTFNLVKNKSRMLSGHITCGKKEPERKLNQSRMKQIQNEERVLMVRDSLT